MDSVPAYSDGSFSPRTNAIWIKDNQLMASDNHFSGASLDTVLSILPESIELDINQLTHAGLFDINWLVEGQIYGGMSGSFNVSLLANTAHQSVVQAPEPSVWTLAFLPVVLLGCYSAMSWFRNVSRETSSDSLRLG